MPRRVRTPVVRRPRTRLPLITAAIALAVAVPGCAALDGPGGPPADPRSDISGNQLEKPSIKVGVLPVVDVAPLYQAIEKGYFRELGLDVEAVTAPSGPRAVEMMIGEQLDIAFSSYPGAFAAQAKKAANIKIVADAYAARPGHGVLLAAPDSGFRRPEDAGDKRIAVTSTGSISDLATMSVLQTKGVDVRTIKWVQMGLPDMGPALQRGDIDGAVVIEPFVTMTEKAIGAMPVLDIASGPTAEMSMTGWAALDKFTQANPNTAVAFQRALARGIADVKNDRTGVLEPILVKYVKIDQLTAPLVTIADFPESLNPVRLQRVADLMQDFGVIKERLDVSGMLFTGPPAG